MKPTYFFRLGKHIFVFEQHYAAEKNPWLEAAEVADNLRHYNLPIRFIRHHAAILERKK